MLGRPPREETSDESRKPAFGEALAALEQRIDAWFTEVDALSRATHDPVGRRALYDALWCLLLVACDWNFGLSNGSVMGAGGPGRVAGVLGQLIKQDGN